MITASQIRAARALVRWSAEKLAEQSDFSWKTIQRLESVEGVPSSNVRTLGAIKRALEAAGVIFIDSDELGPGVRLRDPNDSRI